jgi:Ca2+-binding RTX toxin-like protein
MAYLQSQMALDYRYFFISPWDASVQFYETTPSVWNYFSSGIIQEEFERSGDSFWYRTFGDFEYDYATGTVLSGTVTAREYYVYDADEDSWLQYLAIEGVEIPYATLTSAMESVDTADDRALLTSAFSGDDEFYLSNYADYWSGFGGNDNIDGNGGNDTLEGGSGNDEIYGGTGNDRLVGGTGNDTMYGQAGTDTLIGGTGNDTYIMSSGDTITERAGEGRDTVQSSLSYVLGANFENLTLTGNAAVNGTGNTLNNTIIGNCAANTLSGGSGADVLIGCCGNDRQTGGTGNDFFVFNTVTESGITATASDVITDFVKGKDKIDLSAIDAFASSGINDAFVWRGAAGFSSNTQGEVRFTKVDLSGTANDYTMVWIDNDADSGVEMAIRLTGLYNLTASDFVL